MSNFLLPHVIESDTSIGICKATCHQNIMQKLGVVLCACNPGVWQTEAGGL